MRRYSVKSTVFFLFGVIVLAGCASSPKTPDTKTEIEVIDRVAQNLVYALVQVPELNPSNTRIQLDRAEDTFGTVLQNRLWDAGYGIQRVSTDNNSVPVTYKIRPVASSAQNTFEYSVSIGDVGVSREYRRDDGNLFPASRMALRGVPVESRVQLNDGIFGQTAARTLANPIAEAVVVEPPPVRESTSIRTRVVDQAAPLVTVSDALISDDGLVAESLADRLPLFKENMYETRESNYADLFASYDELGRDVLVFPNDSLVLGDYNKEVLAGYAKSFNADTDLFSVIGCSHGKSTLKNGNSVLAVGRANRVKEELVAQGIEYGRIMDEGCWAPVPFDEMMPRRGVVLKHMRSKIVSGNRKVDS